MALALVVFGAYDSYPAEVSRLYIKERLFERILKLGNEFKGRYSLCWVPQWHGSALRLRAAAAPGAALRCQP